MINTLSERIFGIERDKFGKLEEGKWKNKFGIIFYGYYVEMRNYVKDIKIFSKQEIIKEIEEKLI